MDPANTVLAARSRDAVQKVLMKKWNDVCLEQITETFARRIFSRSPEAQELKSKAASILVHLLKWGSDHGHCQPPTFTFDIAKADGDADKCKPADVQEPAGTVKARELIGLTESDVKRTAADDAPEPCDEHRDALPNDEKPLVKVKPEALTRRKAELKERKSETKTEEDMEPKKSRGKQPKPVAQLDAKTLQVIKVWPSRSEAERELGACNLDRAISRKRLAAGFFWCPPEDAEGFQPNPLSRLEHKPAAEKKPKPLVDKSGEQQQAFEQTKQKGKTVITKPAAAEEEQKRSVAADALAVFTDEELMKKLESRGWYGELRRTQVITIGK